MSTPNANVGFLKVNGQIHPVKRSTLAGLVNRWDFYSDGTTLYVKVEANPTTLVTDVRAAVGSHCLIPGSSMVISGLELVGSGSHGISGDGTAHDVKVTGTYIREIGGSYLTGTLRYGNGVQAWIGSQDWDVSFNDISDIYDVATTMQGPSNGTTAIGWKNVHFRHNRIWNSTQTFEIWAESAGFESVPNSGWINCSFRDNICLNAGYSFGSDVREDKAGKRAHLLNYNLQLPVDIDVTGNVFFGAKDGYYYRNTGDFKPPAGYRLDNNDIFLMPGQKVQHQTAQTAEEFAAWATASGADRTSRLYLMPESVDNLDDALNHLAGIEALSASQAKNLGRAVGELKVQLDIGLNPKIEPASSMATLTKTTAVTAYAPLLTINLINNFARFTGIFSYMVAGDNSQVTTWGFMHLQVEPNSPAGSTYVAIRYMQGAPGFPTATKGFRIEDIIAVEELVDYAAGRHRIGLYLNVRSTYNRLSLKAQNINLESSGTSYELKGEAAFLAALPAGRQIIGS